MDAAAALFVQPEQMSRVGSSMTITRNAANKGQIMQQQNKQQAPMAQSEIQAAQTNDINKIIEQLKNEFSNYKFTVYRCACRFVKLQKILYTSKIPYQLVLAILERHGLEAYRDQDKLMVPPFQFTALLHDIYYACEKLGYFSKSEGYQLENATTLLANFFWNIFDPQRRHSISLLEIKLSFLLLCKLYHNDTLVSEFFNLVVNVKTKCVSKFNFKYMMTILSKFLSYIGEGKAYGDHNVQKVMDQSFARCHNSSGLTEYQFHSLWNGEHTRLLIYTNLLALIKRIEETEHLIHKNLCAGCHMENIIGIRFKCQKCKDLSLCFNCFANGYTTHKHLVSHRMYEIFTEDQPAKRWTHYLSGLCFFHKYGLKSQQQQEETKSFCNAPCIDGISGDDGRNGSGSNAINETRLVAMKNAAVARQKNAMSTTYNTTDTAIPNGGTQTLNEAPLSKNQQQCRESSESQREMSTSLAGLANTATNASERLQTIIDRLLLQNMKLEMQLSNLPSSSPEEISTFLSTHHMFLVQIIHEMRNLSQCSINSIITASTPRNSNYPYPYDQQPSLNVLYSTTRVGDLLNQSINGADLNRSYLEANRSDFSIKDLSVWFDSRKQNRNNSMAIIRTRASFPMCPGSMIRKPLPPPAPDNLDSTISYADGRDTEMRNFKLLLHKVKEIVDDSYSDNAELTVATQNLEHILDSMIKDEEIRRRRST